MLLRRELFLRDATLSVTEHLSRVIRWKRIPTFNETLFTTVCRKKSPATVGLITLKLCSTSIMRALCEAVVISSAVLDRHEFSKQNKTNKTDNGTQHLKQNC